MATFRTSAEVLTPDQALGFVLADVLRQTGGAYQTTTPVSGKFRDCIRAVAEIMLNP